MEFKYRAVDARPPPPSPTLGFFSDQPSRYGSSSRVDTRSMAKVEYDRMRARPFIDYEEIERENREIREDFMALRRRMLEAKVRREMMLEREMALQGGNIVHFPYDERSTRCLHHGYPMMMRHCDCLFMGDSWMVPRSGPSDALLLNQPQPHEDFSVDLNPLPNKDRVIMLPKPDPNISGAKRKAESKSPTPDVTESPIVSLAKKPKEGWTCALCEISATSEKGLNEHLQGKKHKFKEAQLSGKDVDTGNAKGKESGEPSKKARFKISTNEIFFRASSGATKSNDEVTRKEKKFRHWCEMCQRGSFSAVVFESHLKGKEHLTRLQELGK